MSLDYKNLDDSCDQTDSCLAEKLSRIAPITDDHKRLLGQLEENWIEVPSGESILTQGDRVEDFYLVKKGWVISTRRSTKAQPMVVDIHHPGDIVACSQLALSHSPLSSRAASNALLCPFPRENLNILFTQSPRLAALFQSLIMIEQAILQDRIAVMSGCEAHVRLCHFLLQTFSRLRLMNSSLVNQFFCPLNQSEIGDTIGVSSVHVSRMFSRLAEMELIERYRNFIKFLDWERAVALTDFTDRYACIDVSWLPEE